MFSENVQYMIRPACPQDKQKVISFLAATDFFREGELKIAEEVFDDAVKSGTGGEYLSYVAQQNSEIVGWICFGPTPCTVGTYDIYWIAVDPARQRSGLGSALVRFAEDKIKNSNGRMIVIETSGSNLYLPTRSFYNKLGYLQMASVDNFYAPGDGKVVYAKYV
jgi:ribosomal protein S18 acetylase RimI-like enzyme